MVSALGEAGFKVIRIKGSHYFIRHADGRATVVPVHRNEILGPGIAALTGLDRRTPHKHGPMRVFISVYFGYRYTAGVYTARFHVWL